MLPSSWRKFKLADLSIKAISYGIVQTGEPVEQGVPCVRVVDLTSSNLDPSKMITTSEEINQSYKRTILEEGELMLALRGEIGLVRLVNERLVGCNLTRGIARISPSRKLVLPEFLLWAIRSPLFRDDLLRRVNGSALQEIPIAELRKTVVPVPPIYEQKRIAEILATWDEAIALTEKTIDAKKRLKKFLGSNLLFGKKRFISVENYQFREHYCFSFPDDWKLVKLSKVFDERRETSSDLEKYVLASLTIQDGLIAKPDRYNRDFLLKDKESNQYRVVYPGDFVYNPMNLRWGAINCSKLSKPALVSAYYNVLIPNNSIAPSSLLLALLTTSQMLHVYNNVGIGSLTEKKRVHLSDFLKLDIPLPSLSEATKIDSTLKTLDQEIFGLTRYKDLLFKQKQGLMQKLLTGELRVAVQEAA